MWINLNNIDPALKTFWLIAIFVSIIFLIQTIITFLGVDWSNNFNADFDGNLEYSYSPFQVFSFRNLINFLIIFSWSGIALYSTFSNLIIIIILSSIFGIFFIWIFFIMLQAIEKLSEDCTFDIKKTIGICGEVYLKIPKKYSGKGKILISYNGSIKELDAVTEGEEILQQTLVKIIDIDLFGVKVEKIKN